MKPDSSTWFELFSIGYFDHSVENNATKSKLEVQTLAGIGIAIGRDEKSNTIKFYNPLTKAYYSPPVFKLDEGRLPVTDFPSRITSDGGLVCRLHSNNTDPGLEPFPPGTGIIVLLNGTTKRGTIQNIPLPPSAVLEDTAVVTPDGTIEHEEKPQLCTVLLGDGTTQELTFKDLLSPATNTKVDPTASDTVWVGIPSKHLFQDAKITLEHESTIRDISTTLQIQTGALTLSSDATLAPKRLTSASPFSILPVTGRRY